jgi:dipeptidase D
MNPELTKLYPNALWTNFAKMCDIPHPSKKEQKMTEFCHQFALQHKLECVVDDVGNVIIRKKATPGMEGCKTVILQGHLDMVPQKRDDIVFDFEKDAIQAHVNGEYVQAKGTTLGADNAIGAAAALAVLESTDIPHGPIEALFTIDEEQGMTGANKLQPGILKGDILLNLDADFDHILWIGCAGGMYTDATFKFKQTPATAKDNVSYKINISGLKGGHSGVDIHLGRGNSVKLIGRLLWNLQQKFNIQLANIDGGSVHNAIPRSAIATVIFPAKFEKEFIAYVKNFEKDVLNEIATVDPNVKIEASVAEFPKTVIDETTQKTLIQVICACDNGVIGMSPDIPDLVETSNNLAQVFIKDDAIELYTLQRSSVDSLLKNVSDSLVCLFSLAGAKITIHDNYPGWKPNINSPILKTMEAVYTKKYGQKPEIKAIHAGLECGLLGKIYPNLDMISIGPNIEFAHSPDERVSIKSVGKFWDLLLETLKNIPKK